MALHHAHPLPPELTVVGAGNTWRCIYRMSYRASSTFTVLRKQEATTILKVLEHLILTVGEIVDASLHPLLRDARSHRPFDVLQTCITTRGNVSTSLRGVFGDADYSRGQLAGYRKGDISGRYEFTFAPCTISSNWFARFTLSSMATAGVAVIPIVSIQAIPTGTQEMYCRVLCNEGTALFAMIDHCIAKLSQVQERQRLDALHRVTGAISHLNLLKYSS